MIMMRITAPGSELPYKAHTTKAASRGSLEMLMLDYGVGCHYDKPTCHDDKADEDISKIKLEKP